MNETHGSVQATPWRLWPALAFVAGVVAVIACQLPWAETTSIVFDPDAFLLELASLFDLDPTAIGSADLGPVVPGVGAISLEGRSDILGIVAIAGGAVAAVGGILAAGAPSPGSKRIGGWIALAGGALVVVAGGAALLGPEGVVERALAAGLREEADRQVSALLPGVPFSGLITAPIVGEIVSAWMAAIRVEAIPTPGVIVTVVSGLTASAIGVSVVATAERSAVTDTGTIDDMVRSFDPRVRQDLLRVLTAPEEVRAEQARMFVTRQSDPAAWEALLDELFADARTRRRVVGSIEASLARGGIVTPG